MCGFDFEYFCEANNPNKHCMESERAAVQVLHMRHYSDGSCWSFLIQQILTASHCEDAKLRAWAWCPLALHALPPLQKVSGMQDSSSLLVLVVFVHPAPRARTKVPHQGPASVSQVAAKLWRNSVWHPTWKLCCAWDCHFYGAGAVWSNRR